MQKKVLTEQALYYGDVTMPKDWEIDRVYLSNKILYSNLNNEKFKICKTWEKLNRYIQEHINLYYQTALVNKDTWGNIYKPLENIASLLNVDPVDLKNSPDFTLLYGVNVSDCSVKISYDDNRRKGRSWTIPITNNKFVMFPSTNFYNIINNQKESLNFILTVTYEYI
tara:strand:+ start:1034 stop:1537 length:504 start_codon:yes stop_codon:yes gene_type:complete